jgi:hypothetical protein
MCYPLAWIELELRNGLHYIGVKENACVDWDSPVVRPLHHLSKDLATEHVNVLLLRIVKRDPNRLHLVPPEDM